jgi:hypothetical protein
LSFRAKNQRAYKRIQKAKKALKNRNRLGGIRILMPAHHLKVSGEERRFDICRAKNLSQSCSTVKFEPLPYLASKLRLASMSSSSLADYGITPKT